jgi:predicted RNase H-like nuclease (RuvC/YqgF family)
VVDETVKNEVEYALLRITEKKILADLKIEALQTEVQAQKKELEEKDKRIKELEAMLAGASPTRNALRVTRGESDLNERAEMSKSNSGFVEHTFADIFKPDRQSGQIKQQIEEEDDSFWY